MVAGVRQGARMRAQGDGEKKVEAWMKRKEKNRRTVGGKAWMKGSLPQGQKNESIVSKTTAGNLPLEIYAVAMNTVKERSA